MASTLQVMLRVKGKSRPQTEVRLGGESRSGMHNPKVAGSNPAPATRKDHDIMSWSFCFAVHHSHPTAVLIFADMPTRLYIVTFVKGPPNNPSWIAHDRKRILLAALEERNGFESFNC